MTAFLGNILGAMLKIVYDIVSSIGTEPANISYYAIALIIMTILFKLLLLPVSFHQAKSTKKMNEIQPKMKELQNKYKNDPQTMNIKMAELYKEHNYNPASGCLVLLVQFPIIIAFFQVLRDPIRFAFKDVALYEAMSKNLFWIENLANPDPITLGLPLLAGLTTFLQTKTMPTPMGGDPTAQATQNTMNLIMPIMIFMIARGFPAGVTLYWVVGNMFTIIQQIISNRSMGKIKEVN